MKLPSDFQFSQASLQAFVDCPQRFYLRYVQGLVWPAVEAEPVEVHERRMELGQHFHRMVHQHLVGVDAARIAQMANEPELEQWWRNYQSYQPATALLPKSDENQASHETFPEVTLSAALAGYRLLAKYDLIAIRAGEQEADRLAVIFDWKTSRHRPRRATLAATLQTRVYRYLLVRAGGYINDNVAVRADQVEMIYWFAEFPESPERFPYDAAQYQADEAYLQGLIQRIEALPSEAIQMTDDVRTCRYCPYRSYCDRGQRAGELSELDAELELATEEVETEALFDFDFEQIAEIEF